ncbi:MAG TPA: ABC transporter ATP-binding protein [Chloroflexota bacterium]|nr:ABC transporter ATP-binding protein [Chloroflexota bacterium]
MSLPRPAAPAEQGGNGPVGAPTVLSLRGLHVTYAGEVQAIRGLDLDVAQGETVAVVGESGCGKSTLAAAIMGLLPPTAAVSGAVWLAGVDVYHGGPRNAKEARRIRGQLAGLVIQDPGSSFNPVLRVGAHVVEARRLHDARPPAGGFWTWAVGLLRELRIDAASRRARQYPHEWSGGMLQRAAIAAASANHPRLLVADEPTASLDASLAVDVVQGLRERQQRQGAAMLLITHQLGLAAEVADRLAVMYAGRIVEVGPAVTVIARPRHPYTRGLVAALPRPGGGFPGPLEGELPSLAPAPPGCAFSARCRLAVAACAAGEPPPLIDGVACPIVVPASERGGAGR